MAVDNLAETAGRVMSVTATPSVIVRHASDSGRIGSGSCVSWVGGDMLAECPADVCYACLGVPLSCNLPGCVLAAS